MAQTKNDYQAITGLRRAYIAVMKEDTQEAVSYDTVHEIDSVKTFGVSPESSLNKAYAGNRQVQVAQSNSGATFNMTFHSLPDAIREAIQGETRGEDGITRSNSESVSPYLGIIAEFTKEDGSSRFVGLTKAILTPASEEAQTKEDSVEFGEIALEGEASDRLFDGERKLTKNSKDEDFDFSVLSNLVFLNDTKAQG
ncbi:major tail protein [Corticicoccus populi]|uniref:Major tail protein n=1 Tax=Corticicoccus populi TaxID=1812821 RepID=A0ABW5WR14_9STAP